MLTSRRLLVSITIMLSLGLLLAGCGGGGNGDDSDKTPTTARGSGTATSTRSASSASPTTAAGENTPAGEPSSSGSGASGGGAAPASPTGNAAGPTATRRPATVVSSPRPVATRPSQPTAPPATEVPPTEDSGQFTIVYDDGFDDPSSVLLFTGSTDFGADASVDSGAYILTVPEGGWQNSVLNPDTSYEIADGIVIANVSIDGDGVAGVVGRQFQDDAGAFSFYVCWLTSAGAAGCSVYSGDNFSSLFTATDPVPTAAGYKLALQIVDNELIFQINDETIGSITDGTVASGYWGVYAESITGSSSAVFDTLTIAAS